MITENDTPEAPCKHSPRPSAGRSVRHRKLRVDQVHPLDLADLRRDGLLDPAKAGHVWISKISLGFALVPTYALYAVAATPNDRWLVLSYPKPETLGERATQVVELIATACHFGGRRWWFRCPAARNNVPCRRRCRILYRPLEGIGFACRECWSLTYRCRQRHRHRYEVLAKALLLTQQEAHRRFWELPPKQLATRLRRYQRVVPALRDFVSGGSDIALRPGRTG